MKIVTLGRSAEQSINVGPKFPQVSRLHAEICVLGPDSYRLADLGSPNGTEILEGGRWVRVSQVTISKNQRFRLAGQFEASIEELIGKGYKIMPVPFIPA